MKTAIFMLDKIFLEKRKSKKLLHALNDAYSATESPEECTVREKGKKRYGNTVRKERY